MALATVVCGQARSCCWSAGNGHSRNDTNQCTGILPFTYACIAEQSMMIDCLAVVTILPQSTYGLPKPAPRRDTCQADAVYNGQLFVFQFGGRYDDVLNGVCNTTFIQPFLLHVPVLCHNAIHCGMACA